MSLFFRKQGWKLNNITAPFDRAQPPTLPPFKGNHAEAASISHAPKLRAWGLGMLSFGAPLLHAAGQSGPIFTGPNSVGAILELSLR
ncbi:UNVERIFIED_CONTAM: hypothetical protein K2H54_044115 [Gekko kuhli]